ncbi:asparagine synthase-related protein [Metabacillus sp. GX 13764]|uniref:asparagine synthase-related protein n=1 Tax=Metabacillus kandeliae TaxID=2900151 RepID=UPI001E4BD159|nr:asparagine synthase-related protein [Metabacillus kandeliae]MCD7033159.1 asparagine synthase-related protein [Metabacillus kandeliae]
MSAIVGMYQSLKQPVSAESKTTMMQALEHFPANDVQIFHKEDIFMGCHLQWITPESVGEQIPYYDSEMQLAITADAIIDNRAELFERLQIANTERRTITDSKLILLSYLKWGTESPKYLIGDFAYVIWDEKKQLLFGARDYSGGRTLYYHFKDSKFSFSTTMKPLLTLPFVAKNLNSDWLSEYLSIPYNFESIDPSSTIYKEIYQLPPSHLFIVKQDGVKLTRYTQFNFDKKLSLSSNEEYEEAFLHVFQEAVNSRIRTIHSVGAHLSGGLDSGSVASIAAKSLKKENKSLHTYSYVPVDGFESWIHKRRIADETPFIESTANYAGNIKKNFLKFEDKNPFSEIDSWLEAIEMPYKFYENSFWIKGIYEKAEQDDIGVLLNGQRGNWTVSWGHAMEFQAVLLKKFQLFKLFREVALYSQNIGVARGKIFSVVRKKAFPSLFNRNAHLEEDPYPQMINPRFAETTKVYERLAENGVDFTGTGTQTVFDVRKEQFKRVYYWNINGTYGTKLSLRHRIWDRDPTNDLRVANFCLSVPEDQYVQNGQDRSLIRRSMKGLLHDSVRLNQTTRGIQGSDGLYRILPVWKEFVSEIEDILIDPVMSDLLNMSTIRSCLEKLKDDPSPKDVFEDEFRILMRSLIFHRFMKKLT